ncbi:hypothetical protein CWI77_00280 [Pseudidiomarina planktonica]|nr:hypothetical protein CWI77_00280 [Pseudidiomarina planktonica]
MRMLIVVAILILLPLLLLLLLLLLLRLPLLFFMHSILFFFLDFTQAGIFLHLVYSFVLPYKSHASVARNVRQNRV